METAAREAAEEETAMAFWELLLWIFGLDFSELGDPDPSVDVGPTLDPNG